MRDKILGWILLACIVGAMYLYYRVYFTSL